MGWTINEELTTNIDVKTSKLVVSMCRGHQAKYLETLDKEQLVRYGELCKKLEQRQKKITLHYKDIILLTVACMDYIERLGHVMSSEDKKTIRVLVNRLGTEMYNHPDNDKPNAH